MMTGVNPHLERLSRWRSSLRTAVLMHNQTLLQRVLEDGCATARNLSEPMFEGRRTALHQLVVMSRNQMTLPKVAVQMAVMLVKKGADVFAKDENGVDPPMYLIRQNQLNAFNAVMDAEEAPRTVMSKVA